LIVIFGSLRLVGLCEFLQPRRLRDFPAARRRTMGNLGFWIPNLFIGGFFAPPTQVSARGS